MVKKNGEGEILRCSFCNKDQNDVRKLIAGPTVFICDECVEVCNDIIADDNKFEARGGARTSNLLSSAMMSLQTSTHSSQMKTVGPAISLRTSFWSLLQNEQRRISVSPFFLTMCVWALTPVVGS